MQAVAQHGGPGRNERRIARLMVLEAVTLAAMASMHFSGALGGSDPFQPTHAGVAETLIGVVLAVGAVAVLRDWPRAWSIAVAANAFAVVGFIVGLNFTARGAGAFDVAYHATVLPLLLAAVVALLAEKGAI